MRRKFQRGDYIEFEEYLTFEIVFIKSRHLLSNFRFYVYVQKNTPEHKLGLSNICYRWYFYFHENVPNIWPDFENVPNIWSDFENVPNIWSGFENVPNIWRLCLFLSRVNFSTPLEALGVEKFTKRGSKNSEFKVVGNLREGS